MTWQCPICKAGHGALNDQDHKRAVKHHCDMVHPGETPRSLFVKIWKGRPKRNSAAIINANKRNEQRRQQWKDHTILMLPRPKGDGKTCRITYCATCLAQLGTVISHKGVSCKQQLEKLKTNAAIRMRKRTWFNHLKQRDPAHLQMCFMNGPLKLKPQSLSSWRLKERTKSEKRTPREWRSGAASVGTRDKNGPVHQRY